MRFVPRWDQRGDTIVEVLVALAILASALGIGYGAATSGLKGTQQASEHSQALKIAQAQAEMLELNSSNTSLYSSAKVFCYSGVVYTDWTGISSHPPVAVNTDPLDGTDYPAGCAQGFFHSFVSYSGTAPNDTFTIAVRWAAITGHGNDQVQLNYRVHQASSNGAIIGAGGITNTGSILEDTSMSPQPNGCQKSVPYPVGPFGTPAPAGSNGTAFQWCNAGVLASGSLTTTTTTCHIIVYATDQQFYGTDSKMHMWINGVDMGTKTVNSPNSVTPFTFNPPAPYACPSNGMPQGTYNVQLEMDPSTDGYDPANPVNDNNLWIDRVEFSPT